MTPSEATTAEEMPVFFLAGAESLFGVLTRPRGEPRGVGAVILPGGGFHTGAHVNRLSVRLSRRLAGAGYHALRVDYHGVGESSGHLRGYRLDAPFVDDVKAAVSWLRDRESIRRFILVGGCFGGRTGLAAAARIPGVEGAIALTAPLVDLRMGEGTPARRAASEGLPSYLARGLRPSTLRKFLPPHSFRRQAGVARRHLRVALRVTGQRLRGVFGRRGEDGLVVSPLVLRDLEALVRRGIRVLFVYGDRDPFLAPFSGASRNVSDLMEAAGPLIQVATVEGARAYRLVTGQEEILEIASRWLDETASRRD
jgi:pimeloyl-ACP methyl ester carboxylesterase